MTKHIRLLSVLSFTLVLSAPLLSRAAGGDEEVRKQKLINRNYPVTADDKLQIDNQFGNVVISTWDKQEITVDIEISARAATDEKAQDILNRIDVKENKGDHLISFKTKVDEIHNNGDHSRHSDGDRSFYIDYVIHMPAANRLEIENSFGKTEVPDFKGLVTLTSKFGSLNTGKLENVDAIHVEFGKAYITEVDNGKVSFAYNGESRIGKVNGNVKITSEFSNHVQVTVADNIQDLTVLESYSGIRMIVGKALSAQFDVHTSFGSFHNESEFTISEHKEESDYGPHFDKDYSGTAGDGKAKIRIKSSFGSVRLSYNNGNDNEDDEKDKDKEKDKGDRKRTRVSV
ncbi:MAG TPA: hypothetical protein VHW43_13500 [Puia sp.]|nr:hypothetical protein [Puia sp.]